jgi:ubiquinone/menaquinone biosynthesis C-methylase UbiE
VSHETKVQHAYYLRTAEHYDAMHLRDSDEHGKALSAFMGLAEVSGPVDSVLDVGAGTGRAIEKLKRRWPRARVMGIEPVAALRVQGYKKGIPENELVAGDALSLAFCDDYFDFVIETGVLHHIKTPIAVVKEMTRVARKGIMISDSNNIGQGGATARAISFSAFDCVTTTTKKFPVVHYMNTVRTNGFDLHRGAGQVMIFACKE